MINAIAIDDEPPALRVISTFSASFDFLNLQKTFTRTDEAFNFLQKNKIDLLFLDIQMPTMSGLEFYKKLHQNTMVIFTTAFSEYAVEGFNLNAIDYLLKPFTKERFEQAIRKANDFKNYIAQQQNTESEYLFIKADYSLHKIAFADIVYIEGLDDYAKIHLVNGKPLVARITMKGLLEKLPSSLFVRVHRSYIVPLKGVKQVRNKVISIGDIDISIGSSYEDVFFSKFLNA